MKELKLSKKLEKALNEQITLELQSAYIYNGMRLYFKSLGMPGATNWMTFQTREEEHHAEDFIDFILDMDGDVELGDLKKVTTKYDSILDVFEKGLAHEKEISASILSILDLAIEEKNYAAENFLRHYVDEQIEEEDHFRGYVDLVKMAGDNEAALFKVDSILGKRDH
ncbi:ferritin [Neofamilia massiliensis]|uniref:ferritin n=1 Tax=Neofamilia massiliensis TaxID=1673724 RepID=UPI0006BB99CA|nr:ferritin [Neofamilia massiliensis]